MISAHPVRQAIVDEIRAKATTWEARDIADNHFAQLSKEEILGTLGSLEHHVSPTFSFGQATLKTAGKILPPKAPEGGWPKTREDLRPKPDNINGDPELPRYYNVREAYPMCKPGVLDQKTCGSARVGRPSQGVFQCRDASRQVLYAL